MYISDKRKKILEDFEKKYDLNFNDLELLNQAFIHSSYVRENNLDISQSYERLEFFGDAVLKLVVSEFLYNNLTGLEFASFMIIVFVLVLSSFFKDFFILALVKNECL